MNSLAQTWTESNHILSKLLQIAHEIRLKSQKCLTDSSDSVEESDSFNIFGNFSSPFPKQEIQ